MMDFNTFFDASRATLIPGTLQTLNLPIKKAILHQGFPRCNFSVKLS